MNYSSIKTIQDDPQKFINDCIDFDSDEKDCHITMLPTGHCIDLNNADQEDGKINDKQNQDKDLGRWTIEQSYVYLECLKSNDSTKKIVKALQQRLPKRIQSQIRAHHQKMLRKYGSKERIIQCLDMEENYKLIDLNAKLAQLQQNIAKLIK